MRSALRIKTAPSMIFPPTMSDEKLKAAVDKLLSKYPPEEVAVYLNAFDSMNEIQWKNLDDMLKEDSRLQFGG